MDIPEGRVPLGNGWSAEYDADNDYWIIYDEQGVPLGVVFLPEGENIEDYDVIDNLIPFANLGVTEEETTTERTIFTIIKENPITGDSILTLLGLLVVSALGIFIVMYRNKKKNNDIGKIK